jgi:hypothetical protein
MSDSPIDGLKDGKKRDFLGSMAGTATIMGDIVSPIIDMDEIEAYWEAEYGTDVDSSV